MKRNAIRAVLVVLLLVGFGTAGTLASHLSWWGVALFVFGIIAVAVLIRVIGDGRAS
jgi:hypothetical protein